MSAHRPDTYHITLTVQMSQEDYIYLSELVDAAERNDTTMPWWKVGKDACKSLKRRFGVKAKLVRWSWTGDPRNWRPR